MAQKSQSKSILFAKVVHQNTRRVRYDIAEWRKALKVAENVHNPNRTRLYNIYTDSSLDALLTSQIQNRKLQTLGTPYELLNQNGEPELQQTNVLTESTWFPNFLSQLLDTPYWGHSLWEITTDPVAITLIPRKHVKPQTGEMLIQEFDTGGIAYRQMREYGRYIIETGDNYDVGLLNKAVPHILMKRFAQSCWSEFCEIFGMPMRTLKTNTTDPEMLYRAEQMMQSMGAANYSIIDESETLEYAEAVRSNGEVYQALINLCNQEISLLVMGAILGQDTQHGTRGKEQVSFEILSNLVKADTVYIENFVNSTLLPALVHSGVIPPELRFRFREFDDLEALWTKTREALIHYDIAPEWIEDKFGIPVTPKQQPDPFGAQALKASLAANAEANFFG